MLNAQQKMARRGLVTSSIAPAILGADPNASGREAKRRILGEGLDIALDAMQRGNMLEGATLAFAADVTDMTLCEAPFVAHDNGWSGDSADGLLSCPDTGEVKALVEAKTVGLGGRDAWGTEMTDEVPEKVLIQCHWHLIHHPTVSLCYVPVLLGGFDFRFGLYVVGRNEAFSQHIMQACGAWHARYIKGDEEPPLTGLACDTESLKRSWPTGSGEAEEPSPQVIALIDDYERSRKTRDDAVLEYERVRNELRAEMGNTAELRGDSFKITYRNSKELERIDWEGIVKAGEVSEAVLRRYTMRRAGPRTLRITRPKR